MARDLVETEAGHSGQTAAAATPPIPAITAAEAVAVGYAADVDPTTGGDPVEEDKNAYSQNRIAVSSSVKARR